MLLNSLKWFIRLANFIGYSILFHSGTLQPRQLWGRPCHNFVFRELCEPWRNRRTQTTNKGLQLRRRRISRGWTYSYGSNEPPLCPCPLPRLSARHEGRNCRESSDEDRYKRVHSHFRKHPYCLWIGCDGFRACFVRTLNLRLFEIWGEEKRSRDATSISRSILNNVSNKITVIFGL